jgi:hypothetical protein
MIFSSFLMIGATVIVWLLIPNEFSVDDVASLATDNYYMNSIPNDTNTNYVSLHHEGEEREKGEGQP